MAISKEKQQKMVLSGLVTAVLLVVIYYFWVGPQWDHWRSIRQEIASYKRKIEVAKQVVGEAAKRQEEMVHLRQAMATLEATLPPRDDPFSWVVKDLAAHSDRYALPHPDVKTAPPILRTGKEKTPGYSVCAFSVNVSAGYDECGELIRDLENAYPLAELAKLDIKLGNANSQRQVVTFTIEMLGHQ